MKAKKIVCWLLSIYSIVLTIIILADGQANPSACIFTGIMFLVAFPRFDFERKLNLPQVLASLLCLLRFFIFTIAYFFVLASVGGV